MRARLVLALLAVLATTVFAGPAQASQRGTSQHMARILQDAGALHAFLRAMPKGTDLHTHLSGAVYAEAMVRFGAQEGRCVDTSTFTATYPPCLAGQEPLSDALLDNVLYNRILAAWSMRDFTPGAESGHDHFFASFDKFGGALSGHTGDGLAEVAQRAADQHEQYIEPLITPQFGATSKVAAQVPYDPDFAAMQQKLTAAGLMNAIPAAKADLTAVIDQERQALGCATPRPASACRLLVGFDVQVLRGQPPAVVFAQLAFAFALMADDPRWVGVNMVQPEDGPIALRDYRLQMRMIGFLHAQYPKAHITLHAGELAPGVAPPADLRFHVRDAVEVAHAQRIGHGVDLEWERDPAGLLREMRDKHVCVEINLTSNRQILGVYGAAHPIDRYVEAGVPVTLSTDDEGVERTDLTAQYEQAATDHALTYVQLKRIARTGLECSFLPAREKAQALAAQRTAFARFERRWR